MKRSIARKWAKALDSGEYKQGQDVLRQKDNKFCCLGVLCNLHAQAHPELAKSSKSKKDYLGYADTPPPEVKAWSDMSSEEGNFGTYLEINGRKYNSLVELNDSAKFTFPEIAKVIRKHWKEL